jgi:phosphoglucomutase
VAPPGEQALSEPAWITAIEVFQANDVHVLAEGDDAFTPTPAVSHAILTDNRALERVGRWGRRDAVVQPAYGGRLQVQPPTVDRRTPMPQPGSPSVPTSCSRRKLDGVRRRPIDRQGFGRYGFLGEYAADLPPRY